MAFEDGTRAGEKQRARGMLGDAVAQGRAPE